MTSCEWLIMLSWFSTCTITVLYLEACAYVGPNMSSEVLDFLQDHRGPFYFLSTEKECKTKEKIWLAGLWCHHQGSHIPLPPRLLRRFIFPAPLSVCSLMTCAKPHPKFTVLLCIYCRILQYNRWPHNKTEAVSMSTIRFHKKREQRHNQ